jgi:hypothetical protein
MLPVELGRCAGHVRLSPKGFEGRKECAKINPLPQVGPFDSPALAISDPRKQAAPTADENDRFCPIPLQPFLFASFPSIDSSDIELQEAGRSL